MDGLHLVSDLYGCKPADAALLTDPATLQTLCVAAVREAGLSAVAQLFHSFSTREAPGSGMTGVVLLAESHCAIHTWPEKSAVTLDVYVCNFGADNSLKARALRERLVQAFSPAQRDDQEIVRGVLRPRPD